MLKELYTVFCGFRWSGGRLIGYLKLCGINKSRGAQAYTRALFSFITFSYLGIVGVNITGNILGQIGCCHQTYSMKMMIEFLWDVLV